MSTRSFFLGLALLLGLPVTATAGEKGPVVELPLWSVAPFVLLLLTIALLPLLATHWWHSNRNRGLVAALFAVPVLIGLVLVQLVEGQPTLPLLGHELINYFSFIA